MAEKWQHKKILIYFEDIDGDMGEGCLPYLPENFTCNVNGRNEEIDILEGVEAESGKAGTLNLLKRPGLKTWSIESIFPHPQKPTFEAITKTKWTPRQWVDYFESAMYERKVLEMTITGLDIITYVTVESFKHTKEAGEEIDTYYTLDIKEYQYNKIKEEEINIQREMPPKNTGDLVTQPIQPTQPNLGNDGYLFGPAYKAFSIYQGLLNPYEYGGKDLRFNYLPIKVINKHNNPINSIKVKGIEPFADKYDFNSFTRDIPDKLTIDVVYQKLLRANDLTDPKYKSCLTQYMNTIYGGTDIEVDADTWLRQEGYLGNFLKSLLTTSDYKKLKASNGRAGNTDLKKSIPTIIKAKESYAGILLDDLAISQVVGGEIIVEASSTIDFKREASAGDLKQNTYQGSNFNVYYNINKGDIFFFDEQYYRKQKEAELTITYLNN